MTVRMMRNALRPSREKAATAFDISSRAVLLVTAINGVIVAWAPSIPQPLRFPLLFAALLCWTASVADATIRGLIAAIHVQGFRENRVWTTLGLLGIGLAVLAAAQLEAVRLLFTRPDLSWDVDWRYCLNHAQGIARYGSLDRALDYAGGPVQYHVGPAWLAAAVQRLLGFGLTSVLFGAAPILCALSAVIAVMHLLTVSDVPRRLAAAAVGVAASVPLGFGGSFLESVENGPGAIFMNADSWVFATSLMLNSHLGLAVGMSGLALLVDRRSRPLAIIVAGIGLASVVHIKPQYFVGLACVAGIIAVGRIAAWPSIFSPRSLRVFAGCSVAALAAAAAVADDILPRHPMMFETPDVGRALHAYSLDIAGIELLLVPPVIGMLLALFRHARSWTVVSKGFHAAEPMTAALLAFMGLAATLALLRFPIREEVLMRAAAAGVPEATRDAHDDVAQMMEPLRLLLLSGIAAWVVAMVPTLRSRTRLIISIAVGSLVLSPVPYVARGFLQPLQGYEAAEDSALHEVLRSAPRDGSLLISNDLADPAEGTKRSLRGFLLTAYEGHEFYVANLMYLNFLRDDAGERMANLHAFFGSPWTAWHAGWLAATRITHVVVHDRCPPVWWQQRERLLSVVITRGDWSLLTPRQHVAAERAMRPAGTAVAPRYGSAPCLLPDVPR